MAYAHTVELLVLFFIIFVVSSWNMILSWERKGLHLPHFTALRGRLWPGVQK